MTVVVVVPAILSAELAAVMGDGQVKHAQRANQSFCGGMRMKEEE